MQDIKRNICKCRKRKYCYSITNKIMEVGEATGTLKERAACIKHEQDTVDCAWPGSDTMLHKVRERSAKHAYLGGQA